MRDVILWIIRYPELTNFELTRFSCTPELLHFAFTSWLKWIYININNFIHNILIKTINCDTFKQSVQTTVTVHTVKQSVQTTVTVHTVKQSVQTTVTVHTFKQSVQTTVTVHTFIGNGNMLINSQPSSKKFWGLPFSYVSNLSCIPQLICITTNSQH